MNPQLLDAVLTEPVIHVAALNERTPKLSDPFTSFETVILCLIHR